MEKGKVQQLAGFNLGKTLSRPLCCDSVSIQSSHQTEPPSSDESVCRVGAHQAEREDLNKNETTRMKTKAVRKEAHGNLDLPK